MQMLETFPKLKIHLEKVPQNYQKNRVNTLWGNLDQDWIAVFILGKFKDRYLLYPQCEYIRQKMFPKTYRKLEVYLMGEFRVKFDRIINFREIEI